MSAPSLPPAVGAPEQPPAPGLLRLAWPIFAEQSLHMLTNVVSTLMASRIGDNAVAALGSAGQVLVMFLIGFNVLAVGASIATTHHLGLGDRAGARRLARGAVATNLWLGALFSVLLAVSAPTLLRWAQLTPPLMAYALPYLHWMGGTLFMESMIFALCAVLRAHGHTREVMYVILAQNAVNAGLSALLIFGLAGLPALGVTGIAMPLRHAAASLGASRWQLLTEVLLPGALPNIVTGIRTGLGFAWRGLIAAEMIATNVGLGYMLFVARDFYRTEVIVLGMIVIGVLWLLIDRLLLAPLERATIERWGLVRAA